MSNESVKLLKYKISLLINKYNDELFELDNDIKKLRIKIKKYQNKIYSNIILSKEYNNIFTYDDINKKNYLFLISLRNKNLYRYSKNNGRRIKINTYI